MVSKELLDELAKEPKLDLTEKFYLRVFYDLDKERHHSMGFMSIPYTSILQYCSFHLFSRDQTQEICYVVSTIDMIHLNKLSQEQEKEAKRRKSLGQK